VATIAAGFVGLLSLFNIAGRFFWASLSDHIGRKMTYLCFFALGIVLYASTPSLSHMGSKTLFVAAFCVILSMYGGGFATVPAYLADLFGTQFVGAIHGRLLTAWSTAGVIGPLVIGYIRDAQIAAGVDRSLVYDRTFYILASFLVVGLICNLLVRPVDQRWMMTEKELAEVREKATPAGTVAGNFGIGFGGFSIGALIAWLCVGIPLAWGVWNTLQSAIKIFS
jgi:MFS family permease